MSEARIIVGDCRKVLATLPAGSVDCVVTSPPYWGLRDYSLGEEGIGLEPNFDEHLYTIVDVFRRVRHVLADDGTLWLNYGDAYVGGGRGPGTEGSKQNSNVGSTPPHLRKFTKGIDGLPSKSLMMMPSRVAIAMQEDGWILRSEIIWHKPNPMPESIKDRPTVAHEKVFMFSKSPRYFYDQDAVRKSLSDGTMNRFGGDSPNFRNGTFGIDEKNLPHNFSGKKKTVPVGWASSERYKGQDHRHKVRENPTYKKQDGHGPRHAGFNKRWSEKQSFALQVADMVGLPEKGANLRNVWKIPTFPNPDAHFATYPPALVEPCIQAGCKPGGTVLDPFAGSGTTGVVALRENRSTILIEANPEYAQMAYERVAEEVRPMFDTLELVQ